MRADASGQFSLLVITHHLRATEVCAAAEQPLPTWHNASDGS